MKKSVMQTKNINIKKNIGIMILIGFLCAIMATVLCLTAKMPAEGESGGSGTYGGACALVLSEYTVPDYDSTVKVFDPNGKEVSVGENGRIRLLSEGNYKIVYSDRTVYLASLFFAPEVTLSLKSQPEQSYISGQTVELPELSVDCDYDIFSSYTISVSVDGKHVKTLTAYFGVPTVYTLSEYGNYTFEYYVHNIDGEKVGISAQTVAQNKKTIFADDIPSSINLGESVEIGYPYGYYDGNNYDVKVTALTPGGKSEIIKKSGYTPLYKGEYTIKYECVIDGENITLEKLLAVNIPKVNFSFTLGSGTVEGLKELPDHSPNAGSGWLVRSSSGSAKFNYGGIVDLSGLTKNDNLIEFLTYSDGEEVFMNDIRVTFTDIFDDENSFTVHWYRNRWGYINSYLTVEFGDVEYGISNETATFGELRKGYGASAYYTSFMPDVYESKYLFNLQYDYSENTLYFITRDNQKPTEPKQYTLLPLSDSSVLPADYLFKGFTTGEVYVSIEFSSNSSSGIYLTELAGKKAENLSTENYADNFIIVENSDSIPDGVKNYAYRLPDVYLSALYNGSEGLTATLTGPSGNAVSAENNIFTPTESGEYTLKYTAVYAGMNIIKEIKFNVRDNPAEIEIDSSSASVAFGEYFNIPDYTVTGGIGDLRVNAILTLDGNTVEPEFNGSYLIDGNGKYTVVISAEDFVGYKKSKTFDVTVTEGMIFDFEGDIPDTVVAGGTLVLPSFKAYVYDGAEITAAQNLKTTCLIDGKEYDYDGKSIEIPADCTSITAKFSAGDKYTVKDFNVLAERVTSSTEYFITYGEAEYTVAESGIIMSVGRKGASAEMPYTLAADNLIINFGINDDYADISEVEFVLTDSKYGDLNLELRFYGFDKNRRTVLMNITGSSEEYTVYGTEYTYSDDCGDQAAIEKYAGKKYTLFGVEIDSVKRAVKDRYNSEKVANITSWSNGKVFEGFFERACRLTLNATGNEAASEGAELIISQISNNYFNYYSDISGYPGCDFIGPEIVVYGNKDYKTVGINEKYLIPSARAFDVLSDGGTVTVTVRVSGNTLISAAACDSEKEITLDRYGLYSVIYEATDIRGNVTTKTLRIKVADEIPPTLNVSGTYKETYSVGESVKIYQYTAEDLQGALTSSVFIKDSSLKITFLTPGQDYKFETAGEYEIIYRAVDEAQNVTRVVYSITVK